MHGPLRCVSSEGWTLLKHHHHPQHRQQSKPSCLGVSIKDRVDTPRPPTRSLVQARQLLSRADPAPLSHSLLKAPPASPATSSPAPRHGKELTCGASAEGGGEQGENTSAGILQRRSRPGNWEQAQWSRTEPPDTAGLACEAVIPIALI